jgi:superfamily II DNA or RNA helicase
VHLLDHIAFTTYRSLGKTLAAGTYHKLYLDECHTLKDSHEPGLKAHAAKKHSILGLTGTPPRYPGQRAARSFRGRHVPAETARLPGY